MPYLVIASVLVLISGLAGFLGGLTGTGGIIMPPIMIEVLGFNPHVAMGMAQASYILPCMLAVYLFSRKGQFDPTIAIPMAVPGLVCSFLAARYIKPNIDASLLNILFAFCIVISGVVMLRPNPRVMRRELSRGGRMALLAVLGAMVGIMAGITGSGTNAILVPMMVFFGLDILTVLGSCQLYSLLSSLSGTVGNIMNLDMDYVGILCLVASQMIGMWFGVRLAQRTDTARLKRIVGVVCLLAGVFIMAKEIHRLAT